VLAAIIGVASAVTITDTASIKNFGNDRGFKNKGTIQASDLYATDDMKIGDDAQVLGDLSVTGAIAQGSGTIASGLYDGDWRLAANHSFYSTAGSGLIDWSNATGIWKMPTGVGTIGGVVDIVGAIEADSTAKIGGLATVDSLKSNGTVDIVGAIEADSTAKFGAAVTGASFISNATIAATTTVSGADGAFIDDMNIDDDTNVGGDFKAATITSNATSSGADLVATDDVEAGDDIRVNGALYTAEVARVYQVISNTTISSMGGILGDSYAYFDGALSGESITANTTLDVKTDADIDATLQVGGATDLKSLDINQTLDVDGATNLGGATATNDLTVNSTKTLAVTSADKLTVGGVIVPQEMVLTFPYSNFSVDQHLFTAKDAWQITAVRLLPAVAGTDGGDVKVNVTVCDDTEAPSAGVAALASVLNLKGTANTIQSATMGASVSVASGDSVGLDFTGTPTSAVGCVTIYMKRV
jgi:hypothetical protein